MKLFILIRQKLQMLFLNLEHFRTRKLDTCCKNFRYFCKKKKQHCL